MRIIDCKGTKTAVITMSSIQAAEQAIGVLKMDFPTGIGAKKSIQASVYSVPEGKEHERAHLCSTIEISCHYPSRLAWAHYSSRAFAVSNAKRVDQTNFDGRKITCSFQEPSNNYRGYRPTIFSVSIANLPENVDEAHLLRRMRATDVDLQPLRYTSAFFERFLMSSLPKYGALSSCEISQVRQDATKLFAFARFATATEAHDALEALQPHNLLDCPMKLYVSLINSIKYSVIRRLWPVLEPQIRKAVDSTNVQAGDRSPSVRLSLYNADEAQPIRKFRIYGKDIKALRRVKQVVDTLVKGEIFVHEDGIVWHEKFETASGAQFLGSLDLSTTCAVLKDLRSRTIRFYGEETPRAKYQGCNTGLYCGS